MNDGEKTLKTSTTEDEVRVFQPNSESEGATLTPKTDLAPALGVQTIDPLRSGELPIPMEHSGTGGGKNFSRQGLSGAQWRKLQKQLAVERGETPPSFKRKRKPKERGTPSLESSEIPGNSGVREGVASLSSTEEAEKKRPKKDDPPQTSKKGGTYASAALPRVTLTCGDHLGKEMPAELCNKIREAIVERVLSTKEGDFAPRFSDSFPRKGTMVFVCADAGTKEWLEKCAGEIIPAPDMRLRVVRPEDIPKLHKVGVFLPPGVKNAENLLKAIRVQNGGLDTSRWVILNRGETKPGSQPHVVLGMDEPSYEVIKKRNLRLYAGVGEVALRLLDREPKQSEKPQGEGVVKWIRG